MRHTMSSEVVISLNASEHPVSAVTIFHQSSTAQVTRTFAVDLKAGSNVLEISGLPSKVDQDSPRIHGLGLGTDVRVVDTSCSTTLAHDPHRNHTKNAAAAKQLAPQRKRLTAERAVRQSELALLDDAARALAAAASSSSFDGLMDAFVTRKRDAARAVVELDGQIEELDRESWLLANSHTGQTAAVVSATLRAKRDCRVAFQLTYLVTGATWEPCYDLHATTTSDGKPSPEVSLHYCANITQSTGEDWTDAVLTLSTANAHALRSLAVPEVDALRLVPVRPPSSSTAGGIFGGIGSQQLQQQEQPQPQPQSLLEQQRRRQLLMQQLQQRQQPNLLRELRQHAQSFGHLANAAAHQPAVPVPVQSGFGQFFSLNRIGPPAPAPAPAGALAMAPPAPPAPPPVSVASQPRAFMASAPFGSGPAPPPAPDEDEEFEDLAVGSEKDGAVPDKKSALSLAHRVSLPSDGAAHRVPIAVLALGAALTYVCVPRKARAAGAFIEGRIRNSNTSGYELRAGPVSVFVDGGFVTKTRLPGVVGANEAFTCVLGIDTALKVAAQPRSRTAHESTRSFAEPSKTTTRTVTTTVTNGHAFDVAGLVVRDAIPLGHGDAGIEVVLRRPAGLAQARDGEEVAVVLPGDPDGEEQEVKVRWASEKEGLYEWVCELKAGERITLEAEWEVRAPSSMRWEELRMGVEAGQNKAV